jgi:hypothetical protein
VTIVKGAILAVIAIAVLALAAVLMLLSGDDEETPDDSIKGGLRAVPAEYSPWIIRASAECKHRELAPALLAAQLRQESGFKATAASPVGAQGPAQFMPGTWDTWGRDADGNGSADPTDIGDSVMAQGRMMCSLIGQAKSSGITGDPRALALAGYNAGWGRVQQFHGVPPRSFAGGQTYDYVKLILASMKGFQGPTKTLRVNGTGSGPDALRKAAGRLGTPYSWGGGGPGGPTTGFCDGSNGYLRGRCAAIGTEGFDCSSLVQYAYWPDMKLPRTAHAQFNSTSDAPVTRDRLKPGDLLFWAHRDGSIYHVALYAGGGKVLQAPRTGRDVELAPITSAMPAADYAGATRP